MKKLYLHIGTHKTGTSSLQQLCYKYYRELNNENINILRHNEIPYKSNFNDGSVAREKLVISLNKWLEKNLKPYEKHFLCWENFSGDLFTLYENRMRNLEVLKEAIPDNLELSLIVVFRRQDDFLQSAYSQAKHQGDFDDSSKHFLNNEYKTGIDWFKYVNELKEVFPKAKLNALPYDKSLFKVKPLHILIGEIINSDFLISYKQKQVVNVGMSTEAMKLFQSVNIEDNSDKSSQKLLRRILQKVSNKGIFNEYNYISYEQKLKLLSLYDESNKKLAQYYWKDKYNISNFSKPCNPKNYNLDEEQLQKRVIQELLSLVKKQKDREKNSILLKIANKVNRVTGL